MSIILSVHRHMRTRLGAALLRGGAGDTVYLYLCPCVWISTSLCDYLCYPCGAAGEVTRNWRREASLSSAMSYRNFVATHLMSLALVDDFAAPRCLFQMALHESQAALQVRLVCSLSHLSIKSVSYQYTLLLSRKRSGETVGSTRVSSSPAVSQSGPDIPVC